VANAGGMGSDVNLKKSNTFVYSGANPAMVALSRFGLVSGQRPVLIRVSSPRSATISSAALNAQWPPRLT
jgi:hypothetical protein